MDTDNIGTIDCSQVEQFCQEFLRGDELQSDEKNTNFESEQQAAFKMLKDNEAGRVNLDDLSKFLWELLR